jgi:hypothetical protein
MAIWKVLIARLGIPLTDVISLLGFTQQLRHVGRDAPRLITAEQLGRRSPPTEMAELLPAVIAHHEARGFFNDPRRRKATSGLQLSLL